MIATAVAVIGIGAGIVRLATVSADELSTYPPIVQKIADKFNLNVDEVKVVFDQDREDHQAEMEVKMTDRLTDAVTDGKITEAQKDLIIAKHEEIQAKMEEIRNLTTVEEKKAAKDALRTEIQQWLADNDIDFQFIGGMGMGMGREHGGMRGGMGMGGMRGGMGMGFNPGFEN